MTPRSLDAMDWEGAVRLEGSSRSLGGDKSRGYKALLNGRKWKLDRSREADGS